MNKTQTQTETQPEAKVCVSTNTPKKIIRFLISVSTNTHLVSLQLRHIYIKYFLFPQVSSFLTYDFQVSFLTNTHPR